MTTAIEELREQHERIKLENEMALLSAETAAINGAAFPGMHIAEAEHLQEAWGDLVPVDEYPGMSGWDGQYNHRGSGLWNTIGAQLGDRSYGQDEQVFRDEIEHARIRAIGRLLCNVSVNAKCAQENLTSYVLGTGFAYKAVSQDGEKSNPKLLAAVQGIINEVLRDNKWWLNREEQLFQRSRRDGEYFVALYHVGGGQVQLRTIEPEQVTEPDDPAEVARHYDLADRPYSWSFGICTDDDDMERVIGYYVRWRTAEGRDTAKFFSSGQMAHCKLNVDNNIKRGFSDFYSIYEALIDAGKLLRNTVKGHTIMSAIAFIRQHAEGASRAQVESMRSTSAYSRYQRPTRTEGSRTQYTHHYAPGTIVDVPDGQEYKAGPMAGQGVGKAAVEVEQATLRIAGSRWCMPEYMISGDASNAAYASTLAAESPFVKYCQRQQNIYRHHYADIFWKALWIAYCAGRFDHLGASWEEIQALVNIHVDVPIVQSRDRNIETNRLRVLWSDGLLSDETRTNEEGYDRQEEVKLGAKPRQISSPFGGGDQAGFPVAGNAVGKAEGSVREGIREGTWDESQHPRGDDGRFISKGDLQAAAKDPKKAEELRAKVTDPKERVKLEKAIGGKKVKQETTGKKLIIASPHRTAVEKRKEAEGLWNDPEGFRSVLSFSDALQLEMSKVAPEYPYPDIKWSWLTKEQQHIVSERLLDKAVSWDRAMRRDRNWPGKMSESRTEGEIECRLQEAAALLWGSYPGTSGAVCPTRLTEVQDDARPADPPAT